VRLRELARASAFALAVTALAAAGREASPAPPLSVPEILAAHCRARAALSTLRTRFAQTKVFTAIGVEEKSTGTFYYRKPDAFRWEYGEPDGSFTVIDGRRGWAVFPRIRQARRIHLEDARREGMLSVVGFGACGPAFAESFDVTALRGRGGAVVLTMRPLRPDVAALFTAIELTLDPRDDLPRMVVLDETTGDRTRFEFLDVRRDVRMEGTLFQYAPPGDYEVID
jgi:outer membrane lipoprotein-sorting protein